MDGGVRIVGTRFSPSSNLYQYLIGFIWISYINVEWDHV